MNLTSTFSVVLAFRRIAGLLLIISLIPLLSQAQSCSCGGPPLLGSLESSLSNRGKLGFSLTLEYAAISDLINIDQQIPDDIRERTVQTALFGIEYGLTDRLSFSTMFSLLQQNRTTSLGGTSGESLQTRSVGDGLLLVKYALWPATIHRSFNFAIGGGVKAPLGKSGLRANGLLISADMQPGTGSWDYLVWMGGGYALSRSSRVAMFFSGFYRVNGPNDRFGTVASGYSFGDELLLTSGLNHDLNQSLSLSMALRYRRASADQFNSQDQPNSGGQWLNLMPAFNYRLAKALTVRGSGQLPIFREVEGLQFSTSYSIALTMFYSFDLLSTPGLRIGS